MVKRFLFLIKTKQLFNSTTYHLYQTVRKKRSEQNPKTEVVFSLLESSSNKRATKFYYTKIISSWKLLHYLKLFFHLFYSSLNSIKASFVEEHRSTLLMEWMVHSLNILSLKVNSLFASDHFCCCCSFYYCLQ